MTKSEEKYRKKIHLEVQKHLAQHPLFSAIQNRLNWEWFSLCHIDWHAQSPKKKKKREGQINLFRGLNIGQQLVHRKSGFNLKITTAINHLTSDNGLEGFLKWRVYSGTITLNKQQNPFKPPILSPWAPFNICHFLSDTSWFTILLITTRYIRYNGSHFAYICGLHHIYFF